MASKIITGRRVALVLVAIAFVAVYTLRPQQIEGPSVTLVDENGQQIGPTIQIEYAVSPAERQKGLMYRKQMPENQGMLFIFPGMSVRSFWMKNTFLPLDMLFIDDQLRVVGIIENVPPQTTKGRSVGKPAKYVLEVNAGVSKKAGWREGLILTPDSPPPEPR